MTWMQKDDVCHEIEISLSLSPHLSPHPLLPLFLAPRHPLQDHEAGPENLIVTVITIILHDPRAPSPAPQAVRAGNPFNLGESPRPATAPGGSPYPALSAPPVEKRN